MSWCTCLFNKDGGGDKKGGKYLAEGGAGGSEVEAAGGGAGSTPAPEPEPPSVEFKHVPEPLKGELASYVRQRKEHVTVLTTTADVRVEVTKNVMERLQPIDLYPKGRQLLGDEEYVLILKDLLNLGNILDDMEQTGWVPYQNRIAYNNLYGKVYRLLAAKATSTK